MAGGKTAFTITGSSSGTFSVTPEVTLDDVLLHGASCHAPTSSISQPRHERLEHEYTHGGAQCAYTMASRPLVQSREIIETATP